MSVDWPAAGARQIFVLVTAAVSLEIIQLDHFDRCRCRPSFVQLFGNVYRKMTRASPGSVGQAKPVAGRRVSCRASAIVIACFLPSRRDRVCEKRQPSEWPLHIPHDFRVSILRKFRSNCFLRRATTFVLAPAQICGLRPSPQWFRPQQPMRLSSESVKHPDWLTLSPVFLPLT